MRLQGLRQVEFNTCEAMVVEHDGFRVQVHVTKGPHHTQGQEIRVKRANVVRVERPTTNMAPQPQPQPTVPHTRGQDPVVDMPDTLPGNRYRVLGVRYRGATIEEIKQAYKQLSVKLHPDKNAHHKEKAEGLFKQIGKAKDGLLDTEARRRHAADIQRGDRCQQREHGPSGWQLHCGVYTPTVTMRTRTTGIVSPGHEVPHLTRGHVGHRRAGQLPLAGPYYTYVLGFHEVHDHICKASFHRQRVWYTHGEWQPVVHINGYLPGENILVSQPGRLLPTDRLAHLIAAASQRR